MNTTYKAIEVSRAGELSEVRRPLLDPGPTQVRIRVEACGVCHTDSLTIEGKFAHLVLPRVPGHEVIGRIDAVGKSVSSRVVGQRVGVGFLAGWDGTCISCAQGDFIHCMNPTIAGVTIDGGYAEVMMVDQSATVIIPKGLEAAEAAPLLCAGVTTFNGLRKAGLKAGALVAVQGVGGLGHLGIQFARTMGFKTVAIGLGPETGSLALELGAHLYIDSLDEDAGAKLQEMGGADAILATAPSGKAMSGLIPGLGVRGKLLVVGLTPDPILADSRALVSGMRSISGSLTGTPIEEQETLEFSQMAGVKPMIEIMPLELAAKAYLRMMSAKARFRIVLVTDAFEKTGSKEH